MKRVSLFITIFLLINTMQAQIITKQINYKGWGNAIQLHNNQIKLIVVPQIGRIIHFSYLNEDNLLYENAALEGKVFDVENPYKVDGKLAHAGFGGNRIWPTIQDYFVIYNGNRGLSDPWIDGSPWEYEMVENGVKITSKVSKYLGIKVTRTITLNNSGHSVNIKQVITKVQLGEQSTYEPIPVTLWSVSKVKNPEVALLPIRANSIFENGIDFQKWPDNINSAENNFTQHGNVGQLVPVPNVFQKMGSDSEGWVAALYNDKVFGQFFTFDKNETYPDGGTSATIFTCTDFTELECLSPEKALKPGESLEFDICWKLKKVNDGSLEKRREQAVEWLASEIEN